MKQIQLKLYRHVSGGVDILSDALIDTLYIRITSSNAVVYVVNSVRSMLR